jgi:hypothetical protein
MDTDINLVLIEDSARRLSLASGLRREGGTAAQDSRVRQVETDQDESFVEDQREALRPAQHVEKKLVAMLHSAPVLVSHLQKVARPHGR